MNTDKLTTLLGLGQAAATAATTFYITASDDGSVNFKSPLFWLGLAIATFMGVKGYFTNKAAIGSAAPKV